MTQKALELIYDSFTKHRATVEKWLSYPRQLQMEYGVNPILAGGCMRDIILGGEVKDLDVFITVSKSRLDCLDRLNDLNDLISHIAETEGWELADAKDSSQTHTGLHSVWNFQSEFQDKPYNIIVLYGDIGQQDVIKDFNFGINMISVNCYSVLAAHPHFLEDVDNMKCTIRNERSRERTMYKYDQLCLKYNLLPLVTPEGLEIMKPKIDTTIIT